MIRINLWFLTVTLLAILCTFGLTNVLAQPETLRVCNSFNYIQFASLNEEVTAKCDDLNAFDNIISELQGYSTIPFTLGSLIVGPRNGNNYGGEHWDLSSVEIAFDGVGTDWDKATKLIFPHEVGHFILDSFLSSKVSLLKRLLELKNRNATYMKYILPILQLRQTDSTCSDPQSACSQKIKEMIKSSPVDLEGPSPSKLREDFYAIHKSEADEINKILEPYHELFADLTQALYFDDPNVNDKAAVLFGVTPEPCRTLRSNLPSEFLSDEPHCRFSAIRVSIWKNFVAPNLPNKKMILEKLANVIWKELENQVNDPQGRPATNSEAGQRLLKRLVTENLN